MNLMVVSMTVLFYLAVTFFLAYKGYKATSTAEDYMLAGRAVNPYMMALSYGATFISSSAIIGFGGAAAMFGMGVVLTNVMNIFLGFFIGFMVLGIRVRAMGQRLEAATFPELLGKRFNSRFIQALSGLIIVLFMPLYTAAVLIGGSRYIEATFQVNYELALITFTGLVACYVITGGMRGVIYTDVFQAVLIFVGLVVMVVYTYGILGGPVEAHRKLAALQAEIDGHFEQARQELDALAPSDLDETNFTGWFLETAGKAASAASMPDSERKQFFEAHPDLAGMAALMQKHPALASKLVTLRTGQAGFRGWMRLPQKGSMFFYVLITSLILGMSVGMLAQPQLAVRFMAVKDSGALNRSAVFGALFFSVMFGVLATGALTNVWFSMPEHGGRIAAASVSAGNIDLIIPTFINRALPQWFGILFMLTLLAAVMSTLSSQFHLMGTSLGRDFLERGILNLSNSGHTLLLARAGIALSVVITLFLAWRLPGSIVAVATASFAGLCAASFLPLYVGGMYWRRMTRAAAIASLCVGFCVSLFWFGFVQMPGGRNPAVLSFFLLNRPTVIESPFLGIYWKWVEALIVALPASTLTAFVVSLITRPESPEHLEKCFGVSGVVNHKEDSSEIYG